jgi:hypothetical protein
VADKLNRQCLNLKLKSAAALYKESQMTQTDREKILTALREKPLKVFEVMKRVNIKNQEDCQALLLKMRDDGAVKFDIHKGVWLAAR